MRPLLLTPPDLSSFSQCRILQPRHDRGASMGAPAILSRGCLERVASSREVGAVGGDVLADSFPERCISRRPAQLGPRVVDRDHAAERGFAVVLGRTPGGY